MRPKLLADFGDAVLVCIENAFNAATSRTADLEARVAELEARPAVKYCGIWRDGVEHRPGDIVTHKGTIWFCHAATTDRPGASSDWQLMVKHARD